MDSITIIKVSFLAPIVILGLLFVTISSLILLRRQPLVLNGLVLAWGLVAAAIVINAGFIYLIIDKAITSFICYGLFIVIVQVIAFSAAIRALRGTMIFGTSPDDYRNALRAALDAVGMEYSETILGFDFIEHPGRLRGPIGQRLGTVQLRLEGVGQADLHKRIADQLRVYFHQHRGDYSLSSALIYGGFGIFGLLLAVYQWGRY
jgi:hypothetical protein